jgi:hypothetical protein
MSALSPHGRTEDGGVVDLLHAVACFVYSIQLFVRIATPIRLPLVVVEAITMVVVGHVLTANRFERREKVPYLILRRHRGRLSVLWGILFGTHNCSSSEMGSSILCDGRRW